MGFINGTLKYIEFSADTPLSRREPAKIKYPEYLKWEKFTKD